MFFNVLKVVFSKNDSEKYIPNIFFINSFLGFITLYLSSFFKIFFVCEFCIDSFNNL